MATPSMTLLELLQAGDSSIAIVGGVLAVIFFVYRWRKNAIDSLRKDLGIVWTNEGDIHSTDTRFVDLSLKLEHGDLFGSLSSSRTNDIFDVHVTPGWFSAHASITHFRGRSSFPIAEVKLSLKENRNRLHWVLKAENGPSFLPTKTELWPSPIQ